MRFLLPVLPLATLLAQAPEPARPPAGDPPAVTFTQHVAPLVFRSCAGCHRPGEVAPFPLLDYESVKKRGRTIADVVADRYMPPWHPEPGYGQFRNEARLSDAEIAVFTAWVAAGMPEGPAAAMPPVPQFPVGWQLGEPDLVVTTSGAFEVPADGRDVYRNFAIALDLPEDRWITAIEVRPQARAVLHHVLVFLDEQREGRNLDGRDGRPGFGGMRMQRAPMIAGWAVGGMPEHLPDGLAIRLPKGADLVLSSHLHPSGKVEREQTTLGLYFAKAPPKRSLVSIQLPPFFGFTAGLDIPAGAADHHLRDQFVLPCDVQAVTIGGHAHMLCRSLQMHGVLPNGDEVPLLRIANWDFDWQNRYTFREMVRLPEGTTLHADLRYDNSDANPANPNRPPRRVRWGRETTDEMGSVTLLVVPADEADLPELQRAVAQKNLGRVAAVAEARIDAEFDRLDRNRDGKLVRDEVPTRWRAFFERLDGDGSSDLSREEVRGMVTLLGEFGGLPGAGEGNDGGGERRRRRRQ
ncbi:MAG: hypothetical protein ACK501_05830 [Planctomycetota bacterium]|jgi:mono/diheme cytochrome c family protein